MMFSFQKEKKRKIIPFVIPYTSFSLRVILPESCLEKREGKRGKEGKDGMEVIIYPIFLPFLPFLPFTAKEQ